MIPVFSIPKIKRRIHSNLEKIRVMSRNLGFTVKSPTPWPMYKFGFKDEYVSEFFEKVVDRIQKNSFPTWEHERTWTTRVDLTYRKGKQWNIEYQNENEILVFTLFRPEGNWNDYDAWKKEQPSPWFKFKVEIKRPGPPYFLGKAGIEYEKISNFKFKGYPGIPSMVDIVARNLKGEKDKYKETL